MWRSEREKLGLACSWVMACSAGGSQYNALQAPAARGTAGQRVNSGGEGGAPCLFWRGSRLASSSLESVGISAAMAATGRLEGRRVEEGDGAWVAGHSAEMFWRLFGRAHCLRSGGAGARKPQTLGLALPQPSPDFLSWAGRGIFSPII